MNWKIAHAIGASMLLLCLGTTPAQADDGGRYEIATHAVTFSGYWAMDNQRPVPDLSDLIDQISGTITFERLSACGGIDAATLDVSGVLSTKAEGTELNGVATSAFLFAGLTYVGTWGYSQAPEWFSQDFADLFDASIDLDDGLGLFEPDYTLEGTQFPTGLSFASYSGGLVSFGAGTKNAKCPTELI